MDSPCCQSTSLSNLSGKLTDIEDVYRYFLLSDGDVDEISDLYSHISSGEQGMSHRKLLSYLCLPPSTLCENVMSKMEGKNNLIDLSTFTKFVLYFSLLTVEELMENFYKYFWQKAKLTREKPIVGFLSMYSSSELPNDQKKTISGNFEASNLSFRAFLTSIKECQHYQLLFYPFINIHISVRTNTLDFYTRDSLYQRYLQRSQYVSYYQANKKYPPLPICHYFYNTLMKRRNPNKFDYYFEIDEIDYSELPLILSIDEVTQMSVKRSILKSIHAPSYLINTMNGLDNRTKHAKNSFCTFSKGNLGKSLVSNGISTLQFRHISLSPTQLRLRNE